MSVLRRALKSDTYSWTEQQSHYLASAVCVVSCRLIERDHQQPVPLEFRISQDRRDLCLQEIVGRCKPVREFAGRRLSRGKSYWTIVGVALLIWDDHCIVRQSISGHVRRELCQR